MRVWIDVLTPKQALFFWAVSRSLFKKGHDVLMTTRSYEQLDWIWGYLGISPEIVGSYGGATLLGKLVASSKRQLMLLRVLKGMDVSIALSSGSMELCRICYGLKVPHVLASDTPHSPVNRMCVPLSELIATPFAIPKEEWVIGRTSAPRVFRYRALDPYAWIIRYRDLVKNSSDSHRSENYALLRMPETMASYLSGKGFEEAIRIVRALKKFWDGDIVLLPRYREEIRELEKLVGDRRVKILKRPRLALQLIRSANIVLCGGGTMAQESALLGKPTIMFYPGKLPTVHQFLAKKGLIRYISPKEVERLRQIVESMTEESNRRFLERTAERLLSRMEDPADYICRLLERFFDDDRH